MKIRNLLLNCLLLLGSLAISLAIGEVFSRIYLGPKLANEGSLYEGFAKKPLGSTENPGDRSVHIPSQKLVVANTPVTINNLGLRDAVDRTIEKPPGTLRIALFGDSFSFGQGVGDEETLPAQLEKLLAARVDGRCPVEVFNFGVLGFNTIQEYIYCARFGMETRPDLVLFQWYLNDFDRLAYRAGALDAVREGRFIEREDRVDRADRRERRAGIGTRIAQWIASNSNLYDFAVPRLKGLLSAAFGAQVDPESARLIDFDSEGARLSIASLAEARRLCDGKGIAFGVIIYPSMVELGTDYYEQNLYGKLESILREQGIPVINLYTATFAVNKDEDLVASRRDYHPNGKAQGLAAAAVADWLMSGGGPALRCPSPGEETAGRGENRPAAGKAPPGANPPSGPDPTDLRARG